MFTGPDSDYKLGWEVKPHTQAHSHASTHTHTQEHTPIAHAKGQREIADLHTIYMRWCNNLMIAL